MQDSVDASTIGIASGQRVDRSTIVKRYLKDCEGGRGPTMSTCMCPNRRLGWGKEPIPDSVCRCTFDLWHARHALVQFLASLEMESQMNFSFINFAVERLEGWARP